jgi:hypothetical protein
MMDDKPTQPILDVAREAIDLAMKCVATGETLLAFVMTQGEPGAIVTLAGDSFEEVLAMAQGKVDELGDETRAFAFAYDGFITLRDERNDCIYVEATETSCDKLYMFAQRYRPKKFLRPVKRMGNWMCLETGAPKLNWKAEQHARQVSSEAAPSASPDEPSA